MRQVIQTREQGLTRCVARNGLAMETVYVTFDLDALDPSIMPAVGTPEPGHAGPPMLECATSPANVAPLQRKAS